MRFEFTGRLSLPKDTDAFHPYQENEYESGWQSRRLNFTVISGTNRHMVRIHGLAKKDESNKIYTRTKDTYDKDRNRTPGENVQIDFKDRFKPEVVETIADYKKFVFDSGDRKQRYALNTLLNSVKDGKDITEAQLAEAGISDKSEIESAYQANLVQKHEFISEWDYAEFIKKALEDPAIANMKFKVTGNAEYQYSDKNNEVYMNYIPSRIVRVDDATEDSSTGQINLLFGADAVDDSSLDEKGKYFINGWTREYESSIKGYMFVPTTLVLLNDTEDEKAKKRVNAIIRKFNAEGDEIKEYGVIIDVINGAQQVEITEDMLTEEQLEDLDCGLITMDDIRAEIGNPMGDRISEYRIIKPAKGFTKGSQDTAYTTEDMILIPEDADDDDDLFDD